MKKQQPVSLYNTGSRQQRAELLQGAVPAHPVLQMPFTSWRLWVVGALLLFIVVSCVSVILSAHWNRRQFTELQQLEKRQDKLEVEWGQLLLEESSLSAHGRVETISRDKLDMYSPSPKSIIMVKP
ncbi:cell division protein FtsL [Pokkaliibacter sp. CJK22405]|uniref:cell division protein FtsL n=1 Tax=Pokkaliibacter sp. CJK22405 TaxID=3384615 RepID=UPI003984ABBE